MSEIRKKAHSIYIYICRITFIIIVFTAVGTKAYADDDALDQAKKMLENFYIGQLSEGVTNATSMNEMIESLKDPYTQYLTEDKLEDFLNRVNMKFLGIGVFTEMVPQGMKVLSVMINSPAMETGIHIGDIITMANNQMISDLSIGEATSFINSQEGIKVNLKIIREDKVFFVDVIPRLLPYPTVTGNVIDNHIGYLRVISFGDITFNEFVNKLYELRKQNVDSYIVDLRNNPGGYIQTAVDIAGYFIGKKPALVIENKINNKMTLDATSCAQPIDSKVIFLINDYSASASEVLIAAVKDYKKAFLVGTRTYGKGVAQTMFKLSDGSAISTTTVKFYSPKGNEINNVGIYPDLTVMDMDSLLVAQQLLGNEGSNLNEDSYTKVTIKDRTFEIDTSEAKDTKWWEIYKLIIDNSTSFTTSIKGLEPWYSKNSKPKIPIIQFAEIPRTQYKVGERVAFKLFAPSYQGRVQYRAILWDEKNSTYYDIWDTRDHYYNKWKPYGDDIFTVGFPITSEGQYRIKFFAKRADVFSKNAVLKGMNCDSYIGEIPFTVKS